MREQVSATYAQVISPAEP